MNPFFAWVVSHTTLATSLRECPSCKHVQRVARADLHDSVPCARCRTPIPPRTSPPR